MKLSIGENLKKLRAEKKVTQENLADYLDVTCQAVSRWENGAAYPDIELLPELARFFEVSLEEIMGCENSEKAAEDKARIISNSRYGNIEEAIRQLRELERQYPNNWYIKEHLCEALIDPKPESYDDVLPELRRYAYEAMEKFPPDKSRMFEWFCRKMVIAAPEEEVDEWASMLEVYNMNQRWHLMMMRYQERQDWEKARHYESMEKIMYLREMLRFGPIPETEEDPGRGALIPCRLAEKILDAVVGVPYRDETGAVRNSIMLYERLDNYSAMVITHIGWRFYRGTEQEREDGFAALEKLTELTILYADAVKEAYYVSDNSYLEPQKVGDHWGMNLAEKNRLHEHSLDDCFDLLTGTALHEDVRDDERIAVLLHRLNEKKAELEEYWRIRG